MDDAILAKGGLFQSLDMVMPAVPCFLLSPLLLPLHVVVPIHSKVREKGLRVAAGKKEEGKERSLLLSVANMRTIFSLSPGNEGKGEREREEG